MIAYGEAKSRESKKKLGEKKWEAEISLACKLETTGVNTTLKHILSTFIPQIV